ncbi:hypothetical protein K438DRAFT_1755712 [Mycena galopus ATCC 62051]|nr:hypothetical protein K438DRAFT_1755712 [Mycena galopus ATCC 62051]
MHEQIMVLDSGNKHCVVITCKNSALNSSMIKEMNYYSTINGKLACFWLDRTFALSVSPGPNDKRSMHARDLFNHKTSDNKNVPSTPPARRVGGGSREKADRPQHLAQQQSITNGSQRRLRSERGLMTKALPQPCSASEALQGTLHEWESCDYPDANSRSLRKIPREASAAGSYPLARGSSVSVYRWLYCY